MIVSVINIIIAAITITHKQVINGQPCMQQSGPADIKTTSYIKHMGILFSELATNACMYVINCT